MTLAINTKEIRKEIKDLFNIKLETCAIKSGKLQITIKSSDNADAVEQYLLSKGLVFNGYPYMTNQRIIRDSGFGYTSWPNLRATKQGA